MILLLLTLLSAPTSGTSSAAREKATLDDLFDDGAAAESARENNLSFGRPATLIEAIEIIGNAKTAREVILQRILLAAGQLLDDDRIEESRLRLLGTGFFKTVDFSLRRGTRRGRVVVVIELEERNTILIDRLYLGGSSVSPFFGGFGVHESNLLGTGISASAGFVAGKDRRALDLNVFVPNLAHTPLQLTASGIFVAGSENLDDRDLTQPQMVYSRIGGTLGVGLGVGPAQRVVLDYRLESIHVDRISTPDAALLRTAPSILFDDSILSSLSLIYERDTRDDPFVATQGSRVVLAVEAGTRLIGSSYEFTKYTAEVQQAFRLFGNHALNIRLFGGLIQGQTPFFNQFFAADYAYVAFGRSALPRAIQVNFSRSNDYDDLIASAQAEYSIPIQRGGDGVFRTYVYAGIDLSASASLDSVQEDPQGRGPGGRFPLSFDVGLRLDTWIGTFTLSLAYILDLALEHGAPAR